jgi:hypothetical protein
LGPYPSSPLHLVAITQPRVLSSPELKDVEKVAEWGTGFMMCFGQEEEPYISYALILYHHGFSENLSQHGMLKIMRERDNVAYPSYHENVDARSYKEHILCAKTSSRPVETIF